MQPQTQSVGRIQPVGTVTALAVVAGSVLLVDDPANPWRSMDRAPKDGTWVHVKIEKTQLIYRAHWAEDLSGEDQPPFRGWFQDAGNYFREVPTPYTWRPILSPNVPDEPTRGAWDKLNTK